MLPEDPPFLVIHVNSDEVIARAANLIVGRAAYETVVRLYPRDTIPVSGWGEDHCEERAEAGFMSLARAWPRPAAPNNCPVEPRPLPSPQRTIQPAWFTERWVNQNYAEVLPIGHLCLSTVVSWTGRKGAGVLSPGSLTPLSACRGFFFGLPATNFAHSRTFAPPPGTKRGLPR